MFSKFFILLIFLPFFLFSQSGRSSKIYVHISELPQPKYPAILEIKKVQFKDSRNNVLDALENAEIECQITNSGRGVAYNLILNITQIKGTKDVVFKNKTELGNLKAGESKIFSIPIQAHANISNGDFELLLSISEGNGFDSDPVLMKFKTQEFRTPIVKVLEGNIVSDKNGTLLPGTSAKLEILVQNIGQGLAKDIQIEFKLPTANIYPTDKEVFAIDSLNVNGYKKMSFGFLLNKRYSSKTLVIDVVVTEKKKKYGDRRTFSFQLGEQMASTNIFSSEGRLAKDIVIKEQTLTSDVDINIPNSAEKYDNKIALIIGNENYSIYQDGINSETDVAFAKSDVRVFREYCIKTLGVLPDNIVFRENGTSAQITGDIIKVKNLIKLIGEETEVIVYYAGHGLPQESTKIPYLIPVDVSGANIEAGIKLSFLYEQLTIFKSNKVTVFLDACFTGGARGQGLVAARGTKVKPKDDYLRGNIAVFSASSGTESSMPWKQKNHGLFTYYLLKKLKESNGNISYIELFEYLKNNVALKSLQVNSKNQTPQILTSPDVGEEWKNWEL